MQRVFKISTKLTLRMSTSLFFALCLVFGNGVAAKHLPSFLSACKKSDPQLNECAKQQAINALPYLIKGDKSYKIPNYSPFYIPLVDVRGNTGINFQLKDIKLYGLNATKIQKVEFNLAKKNFYVKVLIPKTQSQGSYLIDGKILSLALKDQGPTEISVYNLTVEYFVDYDLIKKADGKMYIDVDHLNTKLMTKSDKVHYYFGNLFGGNKLLGDNFNNLLNDNPKEVEEISGQSDKELINSIVSSIFEAIFKVVPYDELFEE